MSKHRKRSLAAAAITAATVFSVLLGACSSQVTGGGAAIAAPETMDSAMVQTIADQNAASLSSGTANTAEAGELRKSLSDQKIIERLAYQIETLEFEKSIQTLQELTEQLGGYIQDSGIDGDGVLRKNENRAASYTLRIPQEKLKLWKEKAETIGAVLNVSTSSENVTESYYDTEARLKSLRAQQERLLALMEKADKMADIVELEKALADVVYQIEQLTGTLRQYDSLIHYSTVTVQLYEVNKATVIDKTPVTLGEKISYQFRQSLRWLGEAGQGLLVIVVGGLPILLLAVVMIVIVWVLARRKIRRRRSVPGAVEPKEVLPIEKDQIPPEDPLNPN
ncbi:DUF4349 domain-containing protein [Clostridium minihomine]|uniref:DUF4349 domain-containing protein n=1 Tax=Clostridium minihomine TaxID=2045012 RepID=UPI000C75B8AF|nr:DUF4349 domain-containing protein [Clostridium minihomine]